MPDWLTAVLEEYRSLRAEAVAARDAQLAVLRFGVAIAGALVALGLALREEQGALSGVTLCLVVPGVIFFVVELWIGEIERAIRAGNFVAAIEERLAGHFEQADGPPMGWETWLRKNEDGKNSEHQRAALARTLVIFALFFLLMAGSSVAGVSYLNGQEMQTESWQFGIGTGAIVVMLTIRATVVFLRIKRDKAPTAQDVWPPA